jgi:ABC-type branched-subunit amino acid transport system substrate-binding protein
VTARRTVAVLALVALAAVGCGQKDEARRQSEALQAGAPAAAPAGDAEQEATTTPPPRPDSTTGVTADEIRIGVHAPLTGAGAPPDSFRRAYDLYFTAVDEPIHGRRVRVLLEDDRYNPSGAVAACKKLVEQDEVFLLIGAAGADQIAACARYADSVGVPYVSEGIAREGFDLSTYFATTPTYGDQGRILAEYIANELDAGRVTMVRANTANFEEAEDGFVEAAEDLDLDADVVTIPKDAAAGEVQSAAVQVCGDDPEVVYPLMSPAIFLQLASGVKAQGCTPRWAGVGNTMGINLVADVACGQATLDGGASFFSSFPGLDQVDELDPLYQEAYRERHDAEGDDIGWGLWGAMKGLHTLLEAIGPDLSRQSFIGFLEGREFPAEVNPAVDFRESHFGGTAVHVLEVDCDADPPQYVTAFTFADGFSG